MRILAVNKYLYPKGGCETHMLALTEALTRLGHSVQYFGMEHPDNVPPADRTTTVPYIDYNQLGGWRARLGALGGMVFSCRAYHGVRAALRSFRPDIAHLHNIYHQLSPSVLLAIRAAGVPCVLTAHDYKLVCPSYSLHDGRAACFRCRPHRYWRLLATGCSRRGVVGSLALAAEAYTHHFLRWYERSVDLFIAPSRFLRDRLVEGGFPARKIRVIPNPVDVDRIEPDFNPGKYLLFIGRLSYEKGLGTLLEAARRVPEVPLVIVGGGPLRETLGRQAAGLPGVRFLGPVPPARVQEIARASRAVVLPSEVPENCPLSVLEGFAAGKPAIATRVGGVPELVEPGLTGLLVPPGDPDALSAALWTLWSDPEFCRACGVRARRRVEEQHSMAGYSAQVVALYRSLAPAARHEPAAARPLRLRGDIPLLTEAAR